MKLLLVLHNADLHATLVHRGLNHVDLGKRLLILCKYRQGMKRWLRILGARCFPCAKYKSYQEIGVTFNQACSRMLPFNDSVCSLFFLPVG